MSAQALSVVDSAARQRGDRIPVSDAIPVLDTGRFEQMVRIAKLMASSNLIPETLCATYEGTGPNRVTKWLPVETVTANCFLIVNQAVGWNMDPFAVAQCASVVHGRVCYEGKLIAAVLDQRAGVTLSYEWDDGVGDALGITVSGTLAGETTPRTVKGTVGGWKTTGNNSPWSKPAQARLQLAYRGSREWARLHKPAVILGVYSIDELEAATDRQERRPPPPAIYVADGASEQRKPPAPAVEHKPAVEVAPIQDKREAAPVTTQIEAPAPAKRRPPAPPSTTPAQSDAPSGFALHKARMVKMMGEQSDAEAVERVFDDMATSRMRDLSQVQYEELKTAFEARLKEMEPRVGEMVWQDER
jgi:hypothetical protein